MDLTTLRILWLNFNVAALLDGCTRRILTLQVYRRTPRTLHMVNLFRSAADQNGKPRFIITDHGPQFRKQFGVAMKRMAVHHVRSRVGQPFLNGKVDRLFKSLRIWWRFVLPCLTVPGLQKRLDAFVAWYNEHRVHAALGPMTPSEAAANRTAPVPLPIRTRDGSQPTIRVGRRPCRGDPRLFIVDIRVQQRAA